MRAKILSYEPTYGDDPQAFLLALCEGIIAEIVANSELVPVTQDSGTAGSGIITGSVK